MKELQKQLQEKYEQQPNESFKMKSKLGTTATPDEIMQAVNDLKLTSDYEIKTINDRMHLVEAHLDRAVSYPRTCCLVLLFPTTPSWLISVGKIIANMSAINNPSMFCCCSQVAKMEELQHASTDAVHSVCAAANCCKLMCIIEFGLPARC